MVLGVVAAGAAYLVSKSAEPVFRATAVLLATRPGAAYSYEVNVIEPSQLDPDIYRAAVMQGGLLERALENTVGDEWNPADLPSWRERVRVRVDDSLVSGLLRIEVDDPDPQLAERVSNAVATTLLTWDRERVLRNVQASVVSLSQTVVLLGAQIAAVEADGRQAEAQALRATREQRLAQLRSAEALSLSTVVLGLLEPFRDAVVSPEPVNDRAVFVAVVAFVVFVLLAYLVAFLARMVDPRVRSVDDLANVTGPRLVAEIPGGRSVERVRAAIDGLASKLQLSVSRANPSRDPDLPTGRAIVVTSPAGSYERTLLARHLATSYAEAGWRVLLVDADLREGALSKTLVDSKQRGTLAGYLRGGEFEWASVENGPAENLHVIAAGAVPVEGAAVLIGRAAEALLHDWKSRYQVVLIDASALALQAGTLALVQAADAVVLGVAKDRTHIRDIQAAIEELGQFDTKPVVTALSSMADRGASSRKGRTMALKEQYERPAQNTGARARVEVSQRPRGRS